MIKLGTVGDVNPIEYGGGFIFVDKDTDPWIEIFDGGLESHVDEIGQSSADEIPEYEVTVYRVDLHSSGAEFLAHHSWADWEQVAKTCGQDPDTYNHHVGGACETLEPRSLVIPRSRELSA